MCPYSYIEHGASNFLVFNSVAVSKQLFTVLKFAKYKNSRGIEFAQVLGAQSKFERNKNSRKKQKKVKLYFPVITQTMFIYK